MRNKGKSNQNNEKKKIIEKLQISLYGNEFMMKKKLYFPFQIIPMDSMV
jgi:hypothetical protein